jgi:hypothetical protein
MIYRLGRPEDYSKIKAFVEATGKYHSVEPAIMGGQWMIAEHEDEIRGTVWFFGQAPNAYVDYLAGSGFTAVGLLKRLELALYQLGVRWVRSMIHNTNAPAMRLAGAMGVYGTDDYVFVCKELV